MLAVVIFREIKVKNDDDDDNNNNAVNNCIVEVWTVKLTLCTSTNFHDMLSTK